MTLNRTATEKRRDVRTAHPPLQLATRYDRWTRSSRAVVPPTPVVPLTIGPPSCLQLQESANTVAGVRVGTQH